MTDDVSVNERRVDVEQSSDVSTASSNLMQHIQKYVDDASLLRTQGQELVFTLPLASAHKFAGQLLHVLLIRFEMHLSSPCLMWLLVIWELPCAQVKF